MEAIMQPNKKHKDSVFSTLFNNPDVLRELYSAIEGISIPPDIPIEINTLSDVLIRGQLNDVSFTIDNRLVFMVEHQSTLSDNLPLRFLEYIGKVYEKIVNYERRFQRKLEKIPRPEFIVLYNGNEPFVDHKELKLSDAFMDIQGLKLTKSDKQPLELIVNVYNINQGHNPDILKKSLTLNSYSIFISKIWEYRNSNKTLAESLKLAIIYCIDNDILKDFLMKQGSKVYSLLYSEYNLEDEIEVAKQEAREYGHAEGYAEGHAEGWKECKKQEKLTTAKNMLVKGYTPDAIHEITGLTSEEISNIQLSL